MTLDGYDFAMKLGGDREEKIRVQAGWLRQTFPRDDERQVVAVIACVAPRT